MRTVPAALAALALTVGAVSPALAHPGTEITVPLTVSLTHAATDNVAFHARYPEHFSSAGGILTSNDSYVDEDGNPIEFYVVTDGRGVFTYDISDKTLPVLMDMLELRQTPTGQRSAQEDPSTDGKTLLVDGDTLLGADAGLTILSIEDPTDIQILGSWDGSDHTWTCVTDIATGNGCAFAYGRSNNIIDIRDPENPVRVDPGWKQAVGDGGYVHDLTEVRPGLVVSAGATPFLMDTTDPAAPKPLVHTTLFDHASPNDTLHRPARSWSQFGYHSVEWPREGQDAFVLMGTELGGSGSDCTDTEDIIETWDARPVREALATYEARIAAGEDRDTVRVDVFGAKADKVDFVRLDSYSASERGLFLTGQAPASEMYCAHWMEAERDWHDGGRIAAGYYNRGARFIEVDSNGMMREIGWFTGADAYTASVQWIDDEVVYVHDYRRGLDVLSISEEEATGTYTAEGSVSDRAMTVAQMTELGIIPADAPGEQPATTPLLLAGTVLALAAAVRRRRTPA